MKSNRAKLLALKYYFLRENQKLTIFNSMGKLPVEFEQYLESFKNAFPQLEQLSNEQRSNIYKCLSSHNFIEDDWDLLKIKMELYRQTKTPFPIKLHDLILEAVG